MNCSHTKTVKMYSVKHFLYAILLLFVASSAMAQRHEWAKSIGASRGGTSDGQSLSIDSNNNVYITGTYLDTLFIDGQTFAPSSYKSGSFIAKFNKVGKLKWCRTINIKSTTSGVGYQTNKQIKFIYPNQILVYGTFSESVLKLSAKDSISNPSLLGVGYVVIYDTLGNLVKYFKVFEGDSYGSFGNDIKYNGQMDCDQNGNFYLNFYKSDKKGTIFSLGGSRSLTDTLSKKIVVKYSKGFDSILWFKEFPEVRHFSVLRLKVGGDNNLYLTCYARGGDFTLNGINYKFPKYIQKGFISVLSPAGNFIFTSLINSDTTKYDILMDVTAKNLNNIYILGYVNDSILYQKKWYASKFKGQGFGYIGLLSATKGVKWLRLSNPSFDLPYDPVAVGNQLGRINFDQTGNVYCCLYRNYRSYNIGGLMDSSFAFWEFVKFDSLGNALFLWGSIAIVSDMEADMDSNIIYSGNYNSKIVLNPFTLTFKTIAVYIAKIIDYSIKRGRVKFGPYCAGDSITIPYSKRGIYDSSNYFVAEVSDENGNFDGGESELGRLKSMNGGFVRGVLPSFKVASSGNYRIRIRSTAPAVQSFYQKDTLRLLIYSRDKADPGPTETICYGDSIQLNTFGGTKWTWSPKYAMDDSILRQPNVWPKKTTTYKIIIADSSGCGAPDTAYKLIVVHAPLKSILGFKDSALCSGISLNIPVQFTGGDSTNYQWQWYYVNSPKHWFAMGKGNQKLGDTLFYSISNPSEKLALVLKDDCTNKIDTAYITLSLRTQIEIETQFKDTVLCKGNTITFKAKAKGGLPSFYNWIWKDIYSNLVLSTSDSLKITANQTVKIEQSVNDGCKGLGDVNQFTVFVNPPLKASILTDNGNLNDTTICFNQNLKLFSSGKGGTGSGYNFKWYLNKNLMSTKDTFLLKTDVLNLNTYILNLILKDNCIKDADSVTKTIKVIESPKADFSVGNTCNLKPIQFTFTGTIPSSPIISTFNWDFAGEASSSVENPLLKLNNTGKKTIKLTVNASNGCKDVLTQVIDIKSQAKADFEAEDVCEDTFALFINKTTITSGKPNYRWNFGDGKTSVSDTPAHLYNIGGITQTFNVKMTANMLNGCSDSITKAITINATPKQGYTYTSSGQTVIFTAFEPNGTNYLWTFGDGGTAKTANRQHSYSYSKFPSGKYTACLTVTNLAGCSSDSCIEIQITGGMQLFTKKTGINIFPNPNNGSFTIEIKEPHSSLVLEIYNQVGQIVYFSELNQPNNTVDLNLGNGVYLVKVANGENTYRQSIIVNK